MAGKSNKIKRIIAWVIGIIFAIIIIVPCLLYVPIILLSSKAIKWLFCRLYSLFISPFLKVLLKFRAKIVKIGQKRLKFIKKA